MIALMLMATLGRSEERCHPKGLETEAYCQALQTQDGLSVHVLRLPAIHPSPHPDPLFIIAGGPGQAASQMASLINNRFQSIRTKRDLVFIDQRGTGKSSPIACDLPDKPFPQSYSTTIPKEALKTCGRDIDASHYFSRKAADDIEMVRKEYAYNQINVYAVSYGTRVALTLLKHHPKGIRQLVLDGVIANQTPLGLSFEQDAGRALQRLISDCEESDACGAAFPQLQSEFNQLHLDLQVTQSIAVRNPKTGEKSRISIDQKGFLLALRTILYSTELSSMLPFAIHRAANNDWGPFVALTALNIGGDVGIGLNLSIVCSEDAERLKGSSIKPDPLFKSMMRDSVFEMCSIWPKANPEQDQYKPTSSDLPILLLSGKLDPVTPPSSAEEALKTLSNATHLVAPGAAHNVAMTTCATKEIHAFLDGKRDFENSCILSMKRPPFFLNHYGTEP